jgi:hypothetical protein
MRRPLIALLLLLGAAGAARADDARLLDLAKRKFTFENAGPLSLLHCDQKWEGCGDFENIAPQVTVDWDRLKSEATKKKPASATFADQYGGLWRFTLTAAGKASAAPDFPGYQLSGRGSGEQVNVLADARQWGDARHELGLDKPKKKGFMRLFQ